MDLPHILAAFLIVGICYVIIAQAFRIKELERMIKPFDRDGDGRIGGSAPPRVPAIFDEPMVHPPRHDPYVDR